MVKLRLKVGDKGQVLIPKVFREKYGMAAGKEIAIEPVEEGILLRGRPSKGAALASLEAHSRELASMKIKGPKLGALRRTNLELEFQGPES